MDRLYLAAPFFNPQQSALVSAIERLFADHSVPLFSPRQNDENKKGPPTAEGAAKIFQRNVDELEKADGVLAVLDWLLPTEQELRIVSTTQMTTWTVGEHPPEYAHKVLSPPLNLPDTGTVWEMGYAFKLGIPIAIYTERPKDAALNLMLTQCAFGIIAGLNKLDQWVRDAADTGQFLFEGLPQWEGKNR